MKIAVQCTYVLIVELEDDHNPWFYIEENSCPGTGVVGAKLDEIMEEHDKNGTCWACAAQGENKILEIQGGPHHGWKPEKEIAT